MALEPAGDPRPELVFSTRDYTVTTVKSAALWCGNGVIGARHAADEQGVLLSIFGNPESRKAVHFGVETRFRCPCCGYRTLAVPESLELCPVCWWEDDGQDDGDAEEARLTVNGELSLTEARVHFQACGAAHPRFLRYVRSPQVAEQ